jgi:valyl-tRNA synthetase
MDQRKTFLSLENKHYQPESVESGVYGVWEACHVFSAGRDSSKKPYSIVIPPPNVTGRLHMGHALNNTIQDVLIRYKRMDGFDACWIPGTDHAGISTQSIVKKQLQAEGVDYRALGRDAMIERIWQWREKYGDKIMEQLRRLGCSCTWDRTAFTMDEGLSTAVREAFVSMYEKGLVYRAKYIVNWCPVDQTALSNDETYTSEGGEPGHLWHFKYPRADGKGHVVIATTRPETLLGDAAVAVHPDDERYQDLIGNYVILPIVERRIPVIADEYVDPAFGTGCLKVTPAHDPNDFEIGQRHGLPQINIMNPNATLNEEVPEGYRGLDRYVARDKVVAEMEARGLLEKVEDRMTPLVRAERSKVVIEYRLSDQWFVRMKPLAEAVLERMDGLTFYPSRWEGVFRSWLENTRDWCISRQIWWGHRIPAWYHRETGDVLVSRGVPDEVQANPSLWLQDEDVLDTWFSSALWPYSTFGWPGETEDLQRFYPTNVLVTAKDIIYLWVARMAMTGVLHLDALPFAHVCINSVICDEDGDTMSKSRGNGIDPLHVIEGTSLEELEAVVHEAQPQNKEMLLTRLRKNFPEGFEGVGADALRFTLMTLNSEAQQVGISLKRFTEVGRPFTDKLWNACRFVLGSLQDVAPGEAGEARFEDVWILGQLDRCIAEMRQAFDTYRFNVAFEKSYHFFWDDFCDWYLELSKSRLKSGAVEEAKRVQMTLAEVLGSMLRALHPVVPFITEELWQHFIQSTEDKGLIDSSLSSSVCCALAPYPIDRGRFNVDISTSFERVRAFVRAIRSARVEAQIAPKAALEVRFLITSEAVGQLLEDNRILISRAANLKLMESVSEKPDGHTAIVLEGVTVYLNMAEHRDVAGELARGRKSLEQIVGRISGLQQKLDNKEFVEKAPAHVVAKERAALDDLLEQQSKVEAVLAELAAL